MTQTATVQPTSQQQTQLTCADCQHFKRDRGWCNSFNLPAQSHHPRTQICDTSEPLYPQTLEVPSKDLPQSDFEIGNTVKLIDSQRNHTQWSTFLIVGKKVNLHLHRSTKSYLEEPQWSYELIDSSYSINTKSNWVAENKICHSHLSHAIDTNPDIF